MGNAGRNQECALLPGVVGPLMNPAISRSKFDRYDPDFRSEAQHEMTGIRRDPALSQDAVDRELARS
ncbi:hypothetical protein ASE71_32985 [Ensifer sp. Root954]|nr:hypothetical protein ASD49_29605 [Ensifer sp. Root1298]KQX85607.1 hypothetical protein ASD41_29470 [Ensifer sp. Root1312]KRC21493.1 hypothetical protein ASE29_30290 [Ensifer sp. Root74]KRD60842.1 hypothetical protein ASE71_32985 [Ensifer sp. Root954]